MSNGFSSPRVPEVVIGEDSNIEKLLLSVGGTLVRGVISDAFSTVRQEEKTKYATLWDAQKLRAKSILDMGIPNEVMDAIEQFKRDYNDPSYPENFKEGLKSTVVNLQDHLDRLIEYREPVRKVKAIEEAYAGSMKEILEKNSNAAIDPVYLKEVLGQMDSDIDYQIDAYLENEWSKGEQSPFQDDPPVLHPLFMATSPTEEEKKKFYKLEPDEQLRKLAMYIREKPDDANKNYLLAKQFDSLAQYRQQLDHQLLSASQRLAISKAIQEYDKKLNASKDDRKLFATKSLNILNELDDSLVEKQQFLLDSHRKSINELHDEQRLMLKALDSLDYIDKIQKDGGFESEYAKHYLDVSQNLFSQGYELDDSKSVVSGQSYYSKAIAAETAFQKGEIQKEYRDKKAVAAKMTSDKNKFEESTKAKMMPIMESISQKLTPNMIEEKLSSSYGPSGDYTLIPKTDQYLKSFSLETDANLKAYKSEIGIEIAKLVKSSNLKGLDDNEQEIVNDLANMARNGSFEASDKLYEILQGKSKYLDFEGHFGYDKNAREIYEQYLKLYGILYGANIDAISRFGADYGYAQIQEASIINDPFDDPSIDDSWMTEE